MMSLRAILRFPGNKIPARALTGDDVLDTYMRKLDARLIGSAKIRLLTLAEIKDHLQERKAALLKTGDYEEREASRKAVENLESVDACSRIRNKRLFGRFSSIALFGVAGFVLSMMGFVFFLIKIHFGLSYECTACFLKHGIMLFFPIGLLFGLFMGWTAFLLPEQRLPDARRRKRHGSALCWQ